MIASVLEKDPQAPSATLRRALSLRFYGAGFGEEEQRILARLGRD